MIDTNTEFGSRVTRRLAEERIIWLTTVSADDTPQPRPVWFLWDGESFLVYSKPGTYKLHHIAHNPKVALNLDGDGQGGDIVIFTGEAAVDENVPPADQLPAYAEKYQVGFQRIQMTPAEFAATYSIAIRIKVTGLRGH